MLMIFFFNVITVHAYILHIEVRVCGSDDSLFLPNSPEIENMDRINTGKRWWKPSESILPYASPLQMDGKNAGNLGDDFKGVGLPIHHTCIHVAELHRSAIVFEVCLS